MKAEIKQHGQHDCVVVLTPETDHERILLSVWMRYDSNIAHFLVERFENGMIERVTVETEGSTT